MNSFKLLIFSIAASFLFCSCEQKVKVFHNKIQGGAFGTSFSVQFFAEREIDLSKQFDSIVIVINNSMSTYQEDSDISRINNGDSLVKVDDHFQTVFRASKEIHKETNGIFDPTIGVLVNAWNFGPEGQTESLDSLKINNLLQGVGLNKVTLDNQFVKKQNPNSYIDFNALAKGYAVDVFAEFIEKKGYANFLVEIGGEIRGKGKNLSKDQLWTIGVEDPNFDGSQSFSKVITVENEAMATSGSYRKFKVDENGNRYAHIINPNTGYPIKSNLLSVSVIAKTCMEADAYATALMAMGLQDAKQYLERQKVLKAYFIYENGTGKLETVQINGFP